MQSLIKYNAHDSGYASIYKNKTINKEGKKEGEKRNINHTQKKNTIQIKFKERFQYGDW